MVWNMAGPSCCAAEIGPPPLAPDQGSCAQRVFFKLHSNGTGVPEIVGRVWSDPMRKIISLLDEEQREALRELLDFGTAVFSAGLVVAALKGFVDLVM